MFKDLSDKLHNLAGLAKEAKMETHQFHQFGEQNEQARLFRLLTEYDKLNVIIGHVQYMVTYFDNAYRTTSFVQDFTNHHQAMMLSLEHLNELRAKRDEIEAHIAYLRTVV